MYFLGQPYFLLGKDVCLHGYSIGLMGFLTKIDSLFSFYCCIYTVYSMTIWPKSIQKIWFIQMGVIWQFPPKIFKNHVVIITVHFYPKKTWIGLGHEWGCPPQFVSKIHNDILQRNGRGRMSGAIGHRCIGSLASETKEKFVPPNGPLGSFFIWNVHAWTPLSLLL